LIEPAPPYLFVQLFNKKIILLFHQLSSQHLSASMHSISVEGKLVGFHKDESVQQRQRDVSLLSLWGGYD